MSSRCHSAQLGRGGGPPRLLSTPHTHLPQVSENPTGWMEQEATVKTTAPRPAVPLAPAGGPPGPAAASRAGLSARSMAPPCSHSHPMIPRATEQEVVSTGRRGLGVKLLHKLRPRHCHRLDRNVTGTPRSSGPGPSHGIHCSCSRVNRSAVGGVFCKGWGSLSGEPESARLTPSPPPLGFCDREQREVDAALLGVTLGNAAPHPPPRQSPSVRGEEHGARA